MSTSAAHTPTSLAADPALQSLWTRARQRLERSGGQLAGAITMALTDIERRAVELLIGRRTRGARVSVTLEELDRSLRDSRLGLGLVAMLEGQSPLRDIPAEKAAKLSAEEVFWAGVARHAAVARHPALTAWLTTIRRRGHLRRLDADPQEVLRSCLDLLACLPLDGIDRAVIASERSGDAHALDEGRPLLQLLLHALRHLEQVPPPSRSELRRDLLAAYGILTDSTSTTVLVLNLRPLSVGPITRALALYADAAVPVPVTLQMLHAEPCRWSAEVVWVCENPTVIGLAARSLSTACPPMVCVEGMLSVAARRLLKSLTASGIELRYHGDFDRGGIRIANIIIGDIGARPWRMSADEYRDAVARSKRPLPIKGTVPEARWDALLRQEMEHHRIAIHEEQFVDVLVQDLANAVVPPPESGERSGRG